MKTDYFNNRTIWITGASTGIGEGCAREFAARGARVAITARSRHRLAALAEELGHQRTLVATADVTNRFQLRSAVARIVEAWGGVDTAFFNAGTWRPTDLDSFDPEAFQEMMSVNFFGMVNGIEAVLPVLRQSERPHLVGMSSSVALRGIPRAEAYCASKAAARTMLQALRCQLHRLHIPVTIVSPGFVKSPLTDQNDFPMPFLMETADAARIIADGIAKQKYDIRFPKRFTIGVRILSWLPDALYTRLMAKKVVSS